MLKLLLTLFSCLFLAIAVLQLRQQRLELNYQTNKLHNQIRATQTKLWNQQLQIAIYTSPNAISKTVGDQKLNMVPEKPLRSKNTSWFDQTPVAKPE